MTPQEYRNARSALGWSQRELAKAAGVPGVAVLRLEHGFPQPPAFCAQIEATLCDALGDREGAATARRRMLPALNGVAVAAARQSLGWSQNHLARFAGASRASVKRLETDRPLSAVARVAIVTALLTALRAGRCSRC